MRRWSILSAFLLLGLLVDDSSLRADISIPKRFAKELSSEVDRVCQAEIDRQKLVGLAVGLVRDGKVVFVGGFGSQDRESNTPVTRETMFRWASVSKPVTAVAAMRLVESKKLDLDEDVRELVPEFHDHGVVITPRQILCHQSGIVHYSNGKVIPTKQTYDDPHPFAEVVTALNTFKESPLLQKPGTKFSYSTHAYILLSAVVERAAKRPFAEYVQKTIAKPLGMDSFRPDYQWEEIPHRAVGYRKAGPLIIRSTDTDVSWKLGGGGFISTIDDFTRFGAGLVNGQILKPKTYEEMWTLQPLADGTPTHYALGFHVSGKGLDRRVSHSGSQEKTRTFLLMVPGHGVAVAVMTNSEYAEPEPIARKLLPLVLPGAKSGEEETSPQKEAA